ncbi:MAG: tRNA dihydrouridine synthase DusB [Clostridia bacterium]|nr:tRNA dihydrouridine synthase DusB [Clostridia bacterium]
MADKLPFLRKTLDVPVILAPMAGVTDLPYRSICRDMGCDFTFTEMVSAKGLFYGGNGTKQLLCTADNERPCGIQLFGSEEKIMADMAKRLCDEYMGDISLIDINMGCPAPKIVSNGEGSALMKDLKKAAAVIEAVVKASTLPVSVKFRKGFTNETVNAVEFARMAQDSGAKMLTVHGRTREQMYSGNADWDIIARVKAAVTVPVIGNGDVFSGIDAKNMLEQTDCDGIMVARGAQGNPFIFREIKAVLSGGEYSEPSDIERIDTAIFHARRLQSCKGDRSVVEMRKHAAWYTHGMRDAAKVRTQINLCETFDAMVSLLEKYKEDLTLR